MITKRLIPSLLIVTILLAACATPENTTEQLRLTSEESAFYPAADGDDFGESVAGAFEIDGSSGEPLAQLQGLPASRLIIRTADMEIIVVDTEAAMHAIGQLADANGGWVVSSNVFQAGEGSAKRGNITVRVPAEGFQSALDAIQGMAVEVTSVSTSGQDVTEEFVDLSSRLENLESTAERVRGFLEEAQNTEEALAVNQELSRLEGEIEAIKGRMQFLSQSAAFSTIAVNLTPDALSQPIEVAGWRPEGVVRSALETLISALQGLANVIIWLTIFCLPIALIIGIPLLILFFIISAIRRRRQSNAPAAESEDLDENDVQN